MEIVKEKTIIMNHPSWSHMTQIVSVNPRTITKQDMRMKPTFFQISETKITEYNFTFTMYKRADKKIHPVLGIFPEEARVCCTIPEDPLLTLQPLPIHPPNTRK
jgi:hypothetical protein